MIGVLLLVALAATDILIGVASIGIFWPIFAIALLRLAAAGQFRIPITSDGKNLLLATGLMFGAASFAGDFRPATIVYATLFAFYGLWLTGNTVMFSPETVAKAMKTILIAYFLTSLLASLFILAGMLEFKDFPLSRIYVQENSGETRPLGFSSEPSYSAFIVALSWLALLRSGLIGGRGSRTLLPWTAITLLSLAMLGSIYGYMLAAIVLATMFLQLPARRKLTVVVVCGVTILVAIMMGGGEESRALRILRAVASGDLDEWLIEDTSSFFRFGPFLTYLISADFADARTWLGHGVNTAGYYFVDLFRAHVDQERDAVELGFIPAFLYDFGLVAGLAFLNFIYRTTRGEHRWAFSSMITLLLFNANFSTQLMWFAVTSALISREPIKTLPVPKS